MTTPLRIVMVGLGARARVWMQVIAAHPETEVVALVDPRPQACAAAQQQFPDAVTALRMEDLPTNLAADMVLLVTPPAGREAQFAQAIARRWHVVAEKPLADRISTAESYVRAMADAGLTLIVGLNFRYLPVTQKKKAMLNAQTYGAPAFARFTYERWRDGTLPHLNKYPLEMDQPMLWEQSIHHFDLMRFVYDREPVSIQAQCFNPPWSMYRDDTNVFATITFAGGLVVSYVGTWQGGFDRLDFTWRTDCAEGIIVQRDMFGDLAAAHRHDADLVAVHLAPREPWITDAAGLLAMIVDGLQGRAPVACTGADHLRSLYMVDACIRASREQRTVTISFNI